MEMKEKARFPIFAHTKTVKRKRRLLHEDEPTSSLKTGGADQPTKLLPLLSRLYSLYLLIAVVCEEKLVMGEIARMVMMISTFWIVVVVELLTKTSPANGFYLPGVAPRDFQTGEALEVKVNKLSSTKTQLPYDYYFLSYCKPPKIRNRAENLGEVLRGDRIENSVYSFSMRKPESCKIACRVKLTAASAKNFRKKINDDYRVNIINHHYKKWNENNTELSTCKHGIQTVLQPGILPQEIDADKEIVFTYDVSFESSDIRWASRWDMYLHMNDDQIHWFSIINSLMIVLFLSGMVAMIMARTLYRDIAKYNQLEQDEVQDETGWKLVHADVFRPPTNSSLLCVYVGTGVQVFGMTFVTMIFAMLGFLSPSNRGGLMTVMVFLWVFMGLFAGYSSGYLYKIVKGTDWKKISLKTAFMFPSVLFAIFFLLNALIWGEKSSGAVPFGTMFALVLLWFGISLPLVFLGSFLGFKTLH
ncbi:UNVERIFIED_CONTAM: Transmembrane 9 superfamily member 7 [Sesamum calycinum]|uniref:Transmembrane 9 superfamily member n=1 Tax=Sesamum calycinum TaxID=2727403 RepID=A0AAW2NUQ8_9LAMI